MRTAYRAARLFDGAEPRTSPSGMAVVVCDGRIETVVPGSAVAGRLVVDLGDATILPGLIDTHAHLIRAGAEPYALTVLRAADHAAAHLRAGVTVVRDVGSPRGLAVELACAIDAGVVAGPRVLAGAGDPRHAALPDELAAMVRAGVPPVRVLRAVTRDAARLLGIGADHGALEPGTRADLLVVGGDPCADITALRDVRLVLRGGRTVVDHPGAASGTRELVRACRTILRALSGTAGHFSWSQQRILLEVGARAGTDVADLRAALDIDAGQLSRAVRDLKASGAVEVRRCPADRRRRTVAVTEAGRRAYEQLSSAQDLGDLLDGLPETERARLISAVATVHRFVSAVPR